MKRVNPILAALALLFLVSQARAENRTVLVQVKQGEDKKITVSIYSDDKTDRKSAASVDEAVKAIGGMKGWGSQVGVYVTGERGIRGEALKKLLDAVNDNHWLELEYYGREVPKVVGDHFLPGEAKK